MIQPLGTLTGVAQSSAQPVWTVGRGLRGTYVSARRIPEAEISAGGSRGPRWGLPHWDATGRR